MSEQVEIDKPAEAERPTEIEKPREQFQGEDKEVTVKRSNGKLEGGWEVLGLDEKKQGYVFVANRELDKKKKVLAKELIELQPFKEGEEVPVIRTNGELDLKGWTIRANLGEGSFVVIKTIEGKVKEKTIPKSLLIRAKLAQLEQAKVGEDKFIEENVVPWHDSVPEDSMKLDRIQEDIKYWQDKLNTITRLAQEAAKKATQEK